MNFNIHEQLWMCYVCAYEESKEGEVPDRSKEKSEHASMPGLTPVSEPISDYPKSKKGSSASNSQPSPKKKTCPACRKKMNWYPEDKAWRCPFCEYERRI
jgi:ribosomal protein L37AE/L43A